MTKLFDNSTRLVALPATRLVQERNLVTAIPGPRSLALTGRRESAIPPAVGSTLPVWVADADGGVVLDVDGNSWIDLGSGIAVTTVGASNPDVVAAAQNAVGHFTHTCFMVSAYESYLEVAERLNALTPGDFAKKTILVNSGAEAVENAIKIARYATQRKAIIVLDHAYHGRTNLTMALTAKAHPYKKGFGPFASDIYRVPCSYPLRDGLSGPQAAQKAIDVAEQLVGNQEIAAIIAEPIQGEGGFIVPAPGFLSGLSNWAKQYGIVFIADEIQAGLTRTGDWFASDYEGIEPDLITIAKGIAGGLPLAAVTGRADIMDAVHRGGLGGTYGGNPVACAGALATLDFMREYELNARAKVIETIIFDILTPLTAYSQVAEVRGRGGMIALEFVKGNSHGDSMAPAPEIAQAIAARCHAAGVIILTAGSYGNVIRLLPPLVITESLLIEGIEILAQAIRDELAC